MMTRSLRLAGAALTILCGIAAGAWVYSSRGAAHRHPGIRVAAGEASAPNPSDLVPITTGEGARGAFEASLDSTADGGAADAELTAGPLPAARIPEKLPAFSLKDRDGKLTPIGDFAGKSLVINFWATWCAPCQREIPLLEALHAEWAGRGVAVVGIAVDYRDKVLEFATRFKIDYPLLIGEQDALDAAAALGMATPVFPFTVFTDRQGQVVALFVGELHRPQADLILSVVQNLNNGSIQLPAARQAIADGLSALASKTPS
jgi:thiol-disulfide isomerase/thioredoxin